MEGVSDTVSETVADDIIDMEDVSEAVWDIVKERDGVSEAVWEAVLDKLLLLLAERLTEREWLGEGVIVGLMEGIPIVPRK
jgi:hypothetical protein